MADDVRVALLARPGPVREQLRKSLIELGAILVAEGDPAELDPDAVGKLQPNLMIVSLEPAMEAALERFDTLLSAHDVEVMYDDAEVTRKLEGWDLNRWARHLAAKLLGRDLLPPPPDDAPQEIDFQMVPGAPPTPAQLMDNEKLEDYAAESPELAEWVPTNPSLTGDAPVAEIEAVADERPREPDELPDFDLDLSSIESAMQGIPDADVPATAATTEAPEELSFDGDFSLELGNLEELLGTEAADEPAMPEADEAPLLADADFDGGSINFSTFAQDDEAGDVAPSMDDEVAALAAQLEAFEKSDTRETARDPDFSWAPNDDAAKAKELRATPARTSKPMPDVPAPEEKSFEFGSLSLLDENSLPVEPIKPVAVAAPDFGSLNLSLEPLDETAVAAKAAGAAAAAAAAAKLPPTAAPKVSFDIGSLSLETIDDLPASAESVPTQPGALLVIAGMGGPDAVRQLLSHLPATLPVPVLLYQHLEVGKHERLVDQLAKISTMPVYLAVAGETARAGRVAVLPAGMAAGTQGDALRFANGGLEALVRALPASDSVLVVLSGADPALIDAAASLRMDGGTAYAQSPDTCFDGAAAQALASQGAAALPAAQIAAQVAERWPA